MTSYQESLRYLYSLEGRGMKLGLSNITRLLKSCGNPHLQLKTLHVAGTNGKGSTCAFLASIAMEAGYMVGLYTSPHTVRFTERIRINGREISEKALTEYINQLRPSIESSGATFFETATCIAFRYFAEQKVDLAVIETGLGGRLDATNVLRPSVSVITKIAEDHTQILGSSLKSIAREKAGIIKKSVPCVTGVHDPDALGVLKRIASKRSSRLYAARNLVSIDQNGISGEMSARFRGRFGSIRSVRPGLPGDHQIQNGRLACAAMKVLRDKCPSTFFRLNSANMARGLQKVVQNTGIHGRLEWINRKLVLDVAHNPDAIRVLVQALRRTSERSFVVVFGAMKDKDYHLMCNILGEVADSFVTVEPKISRALPEAELRREIKKAGYRVRRGGSVRAGLRAAQRFANGQKVLVTGSHYVVGEALGALSEA